MLSVNADAKTKKGTVLGFLTGILYLAPLAIAGRKNVCPFASEGCAKACLYSAGRGAFSNVQSARVKKTQLFFDDKTEFFSRLRKAISALVRKASRESLTPIVRLNGTSDLPWESLRDPVTGSTVMELFPTVQFYDYTKNFHRMVSFCAGSFPTNYHLTFSRSESNEPECLTVLKHGGTVAAVFSGPPEAKKSLPETWQGYAVHSGDDTDVRVYDEPGTVVGLYAKGAARKDCSGFVVQFGDSACSDVWTEKSAS